MQRIYLDNAATSWPKPDAVYSAVDRYLRELGAPAGRSAYREAAEVERLVVLARRGVASMLGVDDPRRIVFTLNGTDSLNLAIHGLLRPGDHVVTTVAEHNSVLRPLRYLEETANVSVTRVACDGEGFVNPDEIRAAIRPETRLIAVIHASNVTGALQPIEEIGRIAKEHDVVFLVDAAQSLGHVPFDAAAANARLVAAPGHKGLLGPLGTGVLYVAPEVEEILVPTRQGGTGTQSENDRQPSTLPDRYESGNHNVPGIVGLGAGIDWLATQDVETLHAQEQRLTERLLSGLEAIDGVTIYGPRRLSDRTGVVSISLTGFEPQEVASMLDAAHSIQVRAGFHCAPLMHQSLGTADSGGTVRFSLGAFTTESEIDATLKAVGEMAAC